MARPIRIEYPGAVYHVTARGNERRLTFRDDADRRQFLSVLEAAVVLHGWRVHGFCLMPNHYHLLVETPRGNLSRAMAWVQTTYTVRFNRRHRRGGHLFQGRFKAHLVEADSYAMELLRYVHLNPVRPKDKQAPIPEERRAEWWRYAWSSHLAYAGRAPVPAWLCTEWLSYFDRRRQPAQRAYGRFVEAAFGEALANPWKNAQYGLVLGGEALREKVRHWLRGKPTREDKVHWVIQVEDAEERIRAAQKLAATLAEGSWQIWTRVFLGGERRVDVARAYGYKDGSAVTQILKRLSTQTADEPNYAAQMSKLRMEFEQGPSSFKR